MLIVRRTVLVAVVMAAGCTQGTPTAPTAQTWAGTWRIRAVQPASQVTQTAPAGATYQLTFEGNQVSARVDCNSCIAAFSTAGRSITIGPVLACTRAACSTAAFESTTVAVLAGPHTAWVAGSSLTLESTRGVILLER
jgi:heat shock protein HslJ